MIRILLLPVAVNDVLLESETKEDNHRSESESHNDRHKVDKLLLKKNAIGLEVSFERMADAENNFINKSWLLQSIWNVLEKERPGLLLLAFFAAQLIATPIAVYANWDWGSVIWLYSIVIYVPLDIFKFIIRYASSGKAWDNTLEKRTVFTSKKDYGRGEREAQCATDQRKLYEMAQDQVAVGMGLLAGSTLMLLLYEDHCYAIVEAIDFDMGFASFVLGDNPILSSMPPISSLPSLMVCGIGDRDLLNRVVVMTSLAVTIMAAPAPTSDDLIYALSFSQKQALGVLCDIELI
ncbi:hypothetical protein Tco_0520119 [Tanacetum coccineum]